MAYDSSKPANNDYLASFPPEMREQLRAIIEDAIVNAAKLAGLQAGNLSGNIPVSNGNSNANLNADLLDGKHGDYFSASTHGHSVATVNSDGFESKTDKTKLDGIAAGAEINQNAFANFVVGTTTIQADNKTDTLQFTAGANITLTPDATNDAITIGISDNLVLPADPTESLQAATKQYVDNANAKKLNLAGGTLTGALTLPSDPTVALQAATKQYVDNANVKKLNLAGGTLTGPLTLSGDPTTVLQPATKQYVDTAIGNTLHLSGGTLTGSLTVPTVIADVTGTATNATNADTVDGKHAMDLLNSVFSVISDFNTTITEGIYTYTNSTTHNPNSGYGRVIVTNTTYNLDTSANSSCIRQVALSTVSNFIFTRSKTNGGSWSSWQQLAFAAVNSGGGGDNNN